MSIQEKLTTIAENVPKVYDAGYDAGGLSMSEKLWARIQVDGTRTNYAEQFMGTAWTDELFKPVFDMRVTNMDSMFSNCSITDLIEPFESKGLVFDTSNCTKCYAPFRYSYKLKRIPPLDCTKMGVGYGMFMNNTNLHTVSLLNVRSSDEWTNVFLACDNIINLIITGVIGTNFSVPNTPYLSRASIEGIISILDDTVTGKTASFKTYAINKAFETSAGALDGTTSEEWATLIATKPNWTIAAVY